VLKPLNLDPEISSFGACNLSLHRFDNYFEYQKELAAKVLVPYFESHAIDLDGKRVADVGCGEGGIEAGLVERYPKADFTCFDMNETYLAKARAQNIPRCDFLSYSLLDQPQFADRFDVVIFREVIQSTIEPVSLMKKIKAVSRPGSLIHVAFPPYASPFGGNQHVARHSFIRFLPFVHLLPDFLFWPLLVDQRPEKERPGSFVQGFLEELRAIRRTKISIGYFQKICRALDFSIISEECYLIRPAIAMRYGLPVIRNFLFGGVPFFREITTSGALYLLRKD
jgi:SAM-dependent methyltransferase